MRKRTADKVAEAANEGSRKQAKQEPSAAVLNTCAQHEAHAAAPSNSSENSLFAILCSRVTDVVDTDEEGLDGVDWDIWENQYALQDAEAKGTDGKWYFNTRGRPAAASKPTKTRQQPQRSKRATATVAAVDHHSDKFGDSGILVPKMEGPLVVYKSKDSANKAAEEVMRELLASSPFDVEVPVGTTAEAIRHQGLAAGTAVEAAAAPEAATSSKRRRTSGSAAASSGAQPSAAAAAGWSSKLKKGCVQLSAKRSYFFAIWSGVYTIVSSKLEVTVVPVLCCE